MVSSGGRAQAWTVRLATSADTPALRVLMDRAIRGLMGPFLTPQQIGASFEVMGLDSQLIDDGTYFAIESDSRLIGSGGWSERRTLYGGDHTEGRSDEFLDPTREAARVRAMYTDPDYARRGVGRAILAACEAAMRAKGFVHAELMATLAGEPLYAASGYQPIERTVKTTPSGITIPLVRMGKALRP